MVEKVVRYRKLKMPDPIKHTRLRLEIDYQSGNHLAKDFEIVQALAQFLKDNPDIAKMVNYTPKKARR